MPKPSLDRLRQIIEETSFKNSAKELDIKDEAIKSALAYIRTPLSRTPEIFPQIPNTPLRRAKIQGYAPGQPTITIWFTFDDRAVHLLEIDLT